MATTRGMVLAVAFLLASCGVEASNVTPVQKVVRLLQDMLAKGKAEKQDEEVQFAAYKQFCEDTTAEKSRAIKTANEKMELLKAEIEKLAADADRLSAEIAQLNADVVVAEKEVKEAKTVREAQRADYEALHNDYAESISALQRAIKVLKAQGADIKQQPEMLAQVSALNHLKLMPTGAKMTIDAFLAQDPGNSDAAAAEPEANAYEFHSSGIVDMLNKLLDKFVDESATVQKEEMSARNAFEILTQDLRAQIAQATQEANEKTETKAAKLESKAEAETDLVETTATRDSDVKYLKELVAICTQKSMDFESRNKLRADEIKAITQAIDIISSSSVAGAAQKHLPTLLQGSSLEQLRADGRAATLERVSAYLQMQAKNLDSRVLSALVEHVEVDPFVKVKKLIKDLIVRLMEEANEEAEHKGWCDTELSTNEQTRKEKTKNVEMLHAKVDELQASIAQLAEEIATLSKQVAEIDAAVSEATAIRDEEKEKNTEKIKDAKEAQVAVQQALLVLKEFYAKAADATALAQEQPEAPEIFDQPYQGMQGQSGGVIGLLEVIQSDFARLETETTASEAAAQREYDEFISESNINKAQKTKDIELKTVKKQDQEQDLTETSMDLEGTQKELNAALAYYEKLKPSCINSGVKYEDRVGRRKEELQSLQEALRILEGNDIA